MRELSALDNVLIQHAAERGYVLLDDGRICVLVAWRPRRNPTRARVQFPSGKCASVHVDRVMRMFGSTESLPRQEESV